MKQKNKYGTMYDQALDIVKDMGLTPKPSSEGSPMYVFEYRGETVFLDAGEGRNEIDLMCPIYLSGTETEQKRLLEDARDMAEDDLKDFYVHYIGHNLAYIALFIQIKKTRNKLYKKHLSEMLDKLLEGYTTIMTAISFVLYTQSPEFIASITDDKN